MRNPILKRLGLENLDAYTTSSTTATVVPAPADVDVTVVDLPVVVATDDAVTVVEVPVAVTTAEGEVTAVSVVSENPEPAPVNPETEAVIIVPANATTISTENETATATATAAPAEIPVATLPTDQAPMVEAPVVVQAVSEDIIPAMIDTEIEYQEVEAEVDSASDAVDGLYAVATALEEIDALNPASIVDPDERNIVEIAIASATTPLQDDEFSETVSVETLGAKIKEVWTAVIAAIKAFFAKLAGYFKALKAKFAANSKKVEAAKLEAKKAKLSVKVWKANNNSVAIDGDVIAVAATDSSYSFGATANTGVGLNLEKFNGWVKQHESLIHDLSGIKSAAEKATEDSSDAALAVISAFFDKYVDITHKTPASLLIIPTYAEVDTVAANSIADVLKTLGDNVKKSEDLADKFDSLYDKEQKLLNEIIDVAVNSNNQSLAGAVKSKVLVTVNKMVSLTSQQFNQVQRIVSGQVQVATVVSKKVASHAAK